MVRFSHINAPTINFILLQLEDKLVASWLSIVRRKLEQIEKFKAEKKDMRTR